MNTFRSLAWKLTLAFLLVGLTGAGLVSLFVRQQTQIAFNKFVLDQNQQSLVTFFADYYKSHDSWEGLQEAFPAQIPDRPRMPPRVDGRPNFFTVVDVDGKIVFGGDPQKRGQLESEEDLKNGIAIEVEGKTVGWIVFAPRFNQWSRGTPEGDFLSKTYNSIALSAVIATLVALFLGSLLARTMTRSLRELTVAIKEVTGGKLGSQVKVRTKDELGELAASFNQMSTELAQSTNLRQRMTADIAHDLRTPLSVILGYSEALADEKLEPSVEMFDVMHTEALHLSHLIEDFKVLALADAGELPLARQLVKPDVLIRRVANAQRVQAEKQGIDLLIETAPDLPDIDIDVARIIQALGNLVNNAFRYTPPNGKITLSTCWQDGDVAIMVKDTGSGIAAENLPYVFERSYRGDRARKQHDGEAGLGLAIAKSIVESHGGKITVFSEPGDGATFTITLPAITVPR